MKNTYRKRKYTRILDLSLLLCYLITSIVSFFISFRFGILPKTWLLFAAVACAIVFYIFFVFTLKKVAKWAIVTKRLILICLTLLIASVGFLQNKSRATLEMMATASKTERTIELYMLVPADSQLSEIADLAGKKIGFLIGMEKENATFVKQQLQQDIGSFTTREQMDYASLFTNLYAEKIQAIVMSQSDYKMALANQKGFAKQVNILHTYKKKETATKRTIDVTKQAFTLYLSGLDNMGSPNQQTRSDTNLLLIIDPIANHIRMVSLPRDGYVPNASFNYQNDKLAHTGNDGIENSVKTLENFLGIPIDYYARVSFDSLIAIVDTLGGIHVNVELAFCEQNENRSFAKEDLICLNKGKQKLNGKQALAYSRHRKTTSYGNPGRERAQQRVLQAILHTLLSPSGVTSVNALLNIAPNYVTTNIPVQQISNFIAKELEALKPWTISTITSSTGVTQRRYVASIDASLGPSDVYVFNRKEIHAIVNAYDGAKQQLKMNTYAFDLNDLYKNTPPINTSDAIIYSDMTMKPT